ncbi:hypothetical protein VIGAN_06065200 [Vigna angularis var. angularis]|uniref:Uncharacterized protein n=1 Tax=Vigna angularis var. angularis TaxID=157739 RepID=A0A0S3S9U3_PHAAN|nr:hypothetical protein VIGAN_06065200 [Vigna angularis var. angularis]
MFGVKDKSKIVLVEDPISQEKRLLERRKNAKMEKAAKSISEISLEFIHKFIAHLLPRHKPPTLASPCDSGSPGHTATAPSSRHHSTVATPPQNRRHIATTPLQNTQIATNDQSPQPTRQRLRT